MPELQLTLDLENAPWRDIMDKPLLNPQVDGHYQAAKLVRIGLLAGGMVEGAPSIAMAIEMPDGSYLLAETSWRLFTTTAKAFKVAPIVRAWEASADPKDIP